MKSRAALDAASCGEPGLDEALSPNLPGPVDAHLEQGRRGRLTALLGMGHDPRLRGNWLPKSFAFEQLGMMFGALPVWPMDQPLSHSLVAAYPPKVTRHSKLVTCIRQHGMLREAVEQDNVTDFVVSGGERLFVTCQYMIVRRSSQMASWINSQAAELNWNTH